MLLSTTDIVDHWDGKRQLDEFRDTGQKVQDKNNDVIDALNKRKDEVFEGDWMDKIDDELT